VSVFDTLDAIRLATLHEGLMDMTRFVPTEVAQWRCGWRAIQAALGVISPENSHRSCGEESLARAMLAAWREEPPAEDDVAALNAALILVADHELNASTFAARVAASTGADLYACIGAALATFTGPRHGGGGGGGRPAATRTETPHNTPTPGGRRGARGAALPGDRRER
jgi:citrate synthase